MSKKKSRYLGIHRVEGQGVTHSRVFCGWTSPYLVVEIDRDGHMAIAEWYDHERSYPSGPERGIFTHETDAVACAEKLTKRSGHWYFVLDLRGLGPDEVPIT